jgi:nitrate reductase molybdenum cofactor assembly chaperone NarJ/NarW
VSGHPHPALGAHELRLAWQSTSLLLAYPDEALLARVPLVAAAARRLPTPVADPLAAFLHHLRSTPLPELASAYVETFDHQRRCCLYLT